MNAEALMLLKRIADALEGIHGSLDEITDAIATISANLDGAIEAPRHTPEGVYNLRVRQVS